MKLSFLIKDCVLKPCADFKARLANDPDILSITSDSREIKKDSLFIAVKGFKTDGHNYIDQAFAQGAAAVIVQKEPKNSKKDDCIIPVENSRLAMASIAARFYGNPSKEMVIIGITGTNGKTTTTWLLENILRTKGFSTGVIGTINIRYNGKEYDTPVTTPDSIDFQKTLYDMNRSGVSHVIMEVSSHGIDLNRVDFCDFNIGVFTNLSQDHLDYHKDMDQYFDCKKRLFTKLLESGKTKNVTAILNIDDTRGEFLSNSLNYKTIKVSQKKKTDIFVQNIMDDIHGLSGTICLPDGSFKLKSSLIGRFNLENILCAAGAAFALNINKKYIKTGIENCHTIPGRLEKINNVQRIPQDTTTALSQTLPCDRFLFVDYAHTPGALESILITLGKIAPKRVITIFGCGGDRDRSKRALMGEIACKYSDIAIVSSDNPRTENPDSIINDIVKGLNNSHELLDGDLKSTPFKKGYFIEADRKKAINRAISISKPEDIIIVAGKGHETYQITNSGTIHFDDKEELENAVHKMDAKFKPIAWKMVDLVKALGCDPIISQTENKYQFTRIGTDSRSIQSNHLFLALKGENFDGHTFIKDLIAKGVKGFITQKGYLESLAKNTREQFEKNGLTIFEIQNTLSALGKLA
ncbi:MAG: UDP-N-acetylmuramoyl-L-alanyl-D-glutamate--2,6-diaminopimelate ligase, partial [Desulfobacula sp.]|nr:UDP-N-acetylmuramoyl-L-alanyl-D-glutamate--2,6-diaminopimelate ligase [Desulfobacula sp.]